MPPEAITKSKKLSNKTLIENADPNYQEDINRSLERNRAFKGLIWKKSRFSQQEIQEVSDSLNLDKKLLNYAVSSYLSNAYTDSDVRDHSAVEQFVGSFMMKQWLIDNPDSNVKTFKALSTDMQNNFIHVYCSLMDGLRVVDSDRFVNGF